MACYCWYGCGCLTQVAMEGNGRFVSPFEYDTTVSLPDSWYIPIHSPQPVIEFVNHWEVQPLQIWTLPLIPSIAQGLLEALLWPLLEHQS